MNMAPSRISARADCRTTLAPAVLLPQARPFPPERPSPAGAETPVIREGAHLKYLWVQFFMKTYGIAVVEEERVLLFLDLTNTIVAYKQATVLWASGTIPGGFGRACRTI